MNYEVRKSQKGLNMNNPVFQPGEKNATNKPCP